jgi:hypothetical protein
MSYYSFGIIRFNPWCILSIVCLFLFFKINPHLSVYLIVLLIMISCVSLGVFAFYFCVHIMLISWIFIHLHVCF